MATPMTDAATTGPETPKHAPTQTIGLAKPGKPRVKRPPYAQIHARPLPLDVFPLPAFVPHNPLSLVRILGALLGDYFSRPNSRASEPYLGYFSSETRSVHVTDPRHSRALWEMGFFGKGTLSRSEPSWLSREKARLEAAKGGTSEEWTLQRREERRLFKLERARAEREAVEEQLRREGKLPNDANMAPAPVATEQAVMETESHTPKLEADQGDGRDAGSHTTSSTAPLLGIEVRLDSKVRVESQIEPDDDSIATYTDQEHMQLSLCEAFFLCYALQVLDVHDPSHVADDKRPAPPTFDLLKLFARHATFPPCDMASLRPDNDFLLSYVVYHHYRSLGWVVRSGTKFAVDWMLYNRGPVFSHAEFALVIVPEYPTAWKESWPGQERHIREKTMKWWEMMCINRVQSHVQKTLVLCYVEIPLEIDWQGGNVGAILKSYRVRDFAVRRWLANRSRD